MGFDETVTVLNESYREWLLQKATKADTQAERDRLIALANGPPRYTHVEYDFGADEEPAPGA